MKAYLLLGYFLSGVGVAGFISYSAATFPALRGWAFWLVICISIIFVVAGLLDDFACQFLEISYQNYLAILIGIAAILLIGGVIQWL
jgi:hypothetical protein